MAHLNGTLIRRSRKILFTGAFLDRWTDDCLDIIATFAADPRCRPVVLLPTDIQAEDYAPYYDVRFGYAASRTLEHLTGHRDPTEPNLAFIDFAPELFPDYDVLLPALNTRLHDGWPDHLTLIVLSPSPVGLHLAGFDSHFQLPS